VRLSHTPVPTLDVWAEFSRLYDEDEEDWTQQQIADVKGCSQGRVSQRLKLHREAPDVVRQAVADEVFRERHAEAVLEVDIPRGILAPWLTTEEARTELAGTVRKAVSDGLFDEGHVRPIIGRPIPDPLHPWFKWHEEASDSVRDAVSNNLFDEGHVRAVFGVTSNVRSLTPWLTTEEARTELSGVAFGTKVMFGPPSKSKLGRPNSTPGSPPTKRRKPFAKPWTTGF